MQPVDRGDVGEHFEASSEGRFGESAEIVRQEVVTTSWPALICPHRFLERLDQAAQNLVRGKQSGFLRRCLGSINLIGHDLPAMMLECRVKMPCMRLWGPGGQPGM